MILTEKLQKYHNYHLNKMTNMNFLQAKKSCHLIKGEQQNKLSLYILFQEKLLKNKQKQFKTKQIKAIEDNKNT